jgi:NAD(P)-dependent dehydrogenase (short-subunit alcohol dehydrogenase family)
VWVGRGLAAGDVLCEVLVALEPVVEVTRDDVRRVREASVISAYTVASAVSMAWRSNESSRRLITAAAFDMAMSRSLGRPNYATSEICWSATLLDRFHRK